MIYTANKPKDIFDLDDLTPMWDHFENWFQERMLEVSTLDYDEASDMTAKDLLDYLKEMKYSANDCLKMKTEVPNIYDEFMKVCDQRANEIKMELIGLWREE